ncbi:MAG TPA: hypothetical protein PLV21_04005 [Cyclobacteriaceae bacterium]|nr:hypothetical protein [Cyclobacteriaceae bacterium]HRJ81024.1 hypothetical protein [Cyclobacteriaceae bacterium]
MKRRVAVLLSLFVASNALVLSLHLSAQKEIEHDEFTRNFITSGIEKRFQWELSSPKHYIAGLHDDYLYVADIFQTGKLFSVKWEDNSDSIHTIHIPVTFKDSHISVDYGQVYITDLNHFDIFEFPFNAVNSVSKGTQVFDSTFFVEAVPFGGEVFAIRTLNQSKEYVLALKHSIDAFPVQSPGILEKQLDGLFCVDGMLHYNSALKQLIYVYYYRNEFICMDTALQVVYKGRTIDGVERVQIRVAENKSRQTMTLASPPRIVNKKSHSSGEWLFIHSAIRATNESRSTFQKNDVLDVYSLRDGHYSGSFYIPRINGEKLRDFKVYENLLVTIHGRILTTFDLHNINSALQLSRPL